MEWITSNLNFVVPAVIGIVVAIMVGFKLITVAKAKELIIYAWGLYNSPSAVATMTINRGTLNKVKNYVEYNASKSVLKHINNLGVKSEKNTKKESFGDKMLGGVGQVLTNSAVTMATNWVKKW